MCVFVFASAKERAREKERERERTTERESVFMFVCACLVIKSCIPALSKFCNTLISGNRTSKGVEVGLGAQRHLWQ